jgi:MoaA/NifB/PqqE/SkfB family radical SAM enzyme
MLKKLLSRIYYRFPARMPYLGYAFPCRNVVFELIYTCNLNCVMCPYAAEMRHEEPRGSDFKPLTRDEIAGLLQGFPKGSNITFTGGEPFLKEGILDILEKATERHKVTIATNGTLFNDDITEKMVRWGVQLIGVSIDGPKDIHNEIRRDPQAYDKAMSAVSKIAEQKRVMNSKYPRLNLNGVILASNFDQLYKNIELANEIGADSCTFQVCDPSWNRSAWRLGEEIEVAEKTIEKVDPIAREKLTSALEHILSVSEKLKIAVNFMPQLSVKEIVDYCDNKFDMKKWYCLDPWSTMRISPYGDVFPCLNFKIGNVREQKPAKLWNSAKYKRFRKTLGKATLFDSCVGCCKMSKK